MAVAIWEIEFADDLYIDGYSLDELLLDDIYWSEDDVLYPGEIGYALSLGAALSCPEFDDVLIAGVDMDPLSAQFFILPAVDNPLGLIYGWQFDDSLTFPANKLVFALPLTVRVLFYLVVTCCSHLSKQIKMVFMDCMQESLFGTLQILLCVKLSLPISLPMKLVLMLAARCFCANWCSSLLLSILLMCQNSSVTPLNSKMPLPT